MGLLICNFGFLTEKNGKYYTYTKQVVPNQYVVDLGKNFRGYRFWHKYTDRQIQSLSKLIKHISTQFNIDINSSGIKNQLANSVHPFQAFEYNPQAVKGKVKGILSHTSVRKDKFDVSPQMNLVNMINEL